MKVRTAESVLDTVFEIEFFDEARISERFKALAEDLFRASAPYSENFFKEPYSRKDLGTVGFLYRSCEIPFGASGFGAGIGCFGACAATRVIASDRL